MNQRGNLGPGPPRTLDRAEGAAVVPRAGRRLHPLAAAYPAAAGEVAADCVDRGDLRMGDLLERIGTRVVGAEELGAAPDVPGPDSADPGRWFLNVNTPERLAEARRLAEGTGP